LGGCEEESGEKADRWYEHCGVVEEDYSSFTRVLHLRTFGGQGDNAFVYLSDGEARARQIKFNVRKGGRELKDKGNVSDDDGLRRCY